MQAIADGRFDAKIKSGRTELTAEEKKHLEEEKKRLHEEMEKRRKEFETKAKEIMAAIPENKKARKAMADAGIPQPLIDELAPEEKAPDAAPGAKKK